MFKVTFVIDDKKLGDAKRALALVGAMEVFDVPMLNAKAGPGGIRPRHGSAAEAFVDEMHRRKMDQVTPLVAREICTAIGFRDTSYSHIIAGAVERGLLHKGEKNGNGYIYVITKRLPAPKPKGGK